MFILMLALAIARLFSSSFSKNSSFIIVGNNGSTMRIVFRCQSKPLSVMTWRALMESPLTHWNMLTFCGWSLQMSAEPLCFPIGLFNFYYCFCSSKFHEGAQFLQCAPKLSCMVGLISLVLGIKIAICHVTHCCWLYCSTRYSWYNLKTA